MKSPSQPPSPEDLDVLLGAAYPEAIERRAKVAARHQRKVRSVGSLRLVKDVFADRDAAERQRAAPRVYLHDRPTRSRVLNAFLHELGETYSARARVVDERALAFELFGVARPYLVRMLVRDNVQAALRFATELDGASNEGMARLALPQVAKARAGELTVIARDHEQRRAVAPAGDLLSSCIVATFAARIVLYAERLQGPHAREDALGAVRRLLNRPVASAGRAASAEEAEQSPPAAVRRELTKRGESVTARGPVVPRREESTGTRRPR